MQSRTSGHFGRKGNTCISCGAKVRKKDEQEEYWNETEICNAFFRCWEIRKFQRRHIDGGTKLIEIEGRCTTISPRCSIEWARSNWRNKYLVGGLIPPLADTARPRSIRLKELTPEISCTRYAR